MDTVALRPRLTSFRVIAFSGKNGLVASGQRLELGFELFEADPLGVDRVSQRAAGYAPCIGTHDLPEEAVIGVATAVVAYGGA